MNEDKEPTTRTTVPASELLGCSCIFLPGILSIKRHEDLHGRKNGVAGSRWGWRRWRFRKPNLRFGPFRKGFFPNPPFKAEPEMALLFFLILEMKTPHQEIEYPFCL
jgi:hypothetical protein